MASRKKQKVRGKAAQAKRTARREEVRRRKKEASKQAASRRAAARDLYTKLSAFFTSAGIATGIGRSGEVRVNGQRLCQLLTLLRVNDWDAFVNRVAAGYCSKQFVAVLVRNLRAAGAQAFYDRDLHGFRIEKDGRYLAVVKATSAVVWGEGESRSANFLTDGPHWKAFRQDFETAAMRPPEPEIEEPKPEPTPRRSERPRAPSLPPLTLITDVPGDIPLDLAEAALEASRRIREERRLVFDHEVVLHYRDGDLRLRPLRGAADAVQASFAFTRLNGVRNVRGAIGLVGGDDPLPVRLQAELAGDLSGWIWACALIGLASVTCIDIPQASPRARREWSSRRSLPSNGRSRFRSAPQVRSSTSIWPEELRPVGRWAVHTASYVAGHIRRLSDGRSPSPQARERARAVGLVLRADETYVRPHARGLPDHGVLEFDWRCPHALLLDRSKTPSRTRA